MAITQTCGKQLVRPYRSCRLEEKGGVPPNKVKSHWGNGGFISMVIGDWLRRQN